MNTANTTQNETATLPTPSFLKRSQIVAAVSLFAFLAAVGLWVRFGESVFASSMVGAFIACF